MKTAYEILKETGNTVSAPVLYGNVISKTNQNPYEKAAMNQQKGNRT